MNNYNELEDFSSPVSREENDLIVTALLAFVSILALSALIVAASLV